ncbi:hypothetical protein ANCCAN_26558 [Ancylostoma caninum]|uniref:Transmembrane protein n=1 Tax=Ancylostoma caninum TaxID=29170 RepID=A0A368F6H8_ANCCA|nr:hypothetical protein ANCCAN_26558 [Ancylostoma caninum]
MRKRPVLCGSCPCGFIYFQEVHSLATAAPPHHLLFGRVHFTATAAPISSPNGWIFTLFLLMRLFSLSRWHGSVSLSCFLNCFAFVLGTSSRRLPPPHHFLSKRVGIPPFSSHAAFFVFFCFIVPHMFFVLVFRFKCR